MIPAAIEAVAAAVITDHPTTSPERLAHHLVAELRDLGWHITPPPTPPTLPKEPVR
ncbi:hypothetical protein ABZ863_35010 [Saccharomonospora sp. NPDC046836]|uniref:hypothetical protein n=1 Tax=Saccharomonospora sp. NPDC046836 TaxID=3156921 RepID=UPI0033DAAB6B